MDGELEVLWSLEDQDDGATQTEPTRLPSRFQGLTIEERRGSRVHCFAVGSWRCGSFPHSFGDPTKVTTVNRGGQRQGSEGATNSVKVDLDSFNVRSSNRDRAEEPVFPPPEESDSLARHEKIIQSGMLNSSHIHARGA